MGEELMNAVNNFSRGLVLMTELAIENWRRILWGLVLTGTLFFLAGIVLGLIATAFGG